MEEKSIALLKPFGIILLIWKVVYWSLDLFLLRYSLVFITLITGIIEIYFHFQALTNIASIAKKYQIQMSNIDKKLLKLRTVQTATLTIITCAGTFKNILAEILQYVSIVLLIITLAVSISIMVVMFSFRKNIDERKFNTDQNEI